MANIDFNQNPYGAAPEYGQNLAPGDPGRKLWRDWVGNTENWIKMEAGRGNRITGQIPSMFQGDILQLNRYGDYYANINPQQQQIWVPTNEGGYWRDMSPQEATALQSYQDWAYNQENQPGGGAVQDWGRFQGYGNDTASNDWGGAFSAYSANQAIQNGVAPGAGFGFGTTAGSSPLGIGPNGTYYNVTGGGVQWFDQFGVPIGTTADLSSGPPQTTQGTPSAPTQSNLPMNMQGMPIMAQSANRVSAQGPTQGQNFTAQDVGPHSIPSIYGPNNPTNPTAPTTTPSTNPVGTAVPTTSNGQISPGNNFSSGIDPNTLFQDVLPIFQQFAGIDAQAAAQDAALQQTQEAIALQGLQLGNPLLKFAANQNLGLLGYQLDPSIFSSYNPVAAADFSSAASTPTQMNFPLSPSTTLNPAVAFNGNTNSLNGLSQVSSNLPPGDQLRHIEPVAVGTVPLPGGTQFFDTNGKVVQGPPWATGNGLTGPGTGFNPGTPTSAPLPGFGGVVPLNASSGANPYDSLSMGLLGPTANAINQDLNSTLNSLRRSSNPAQYPFLSGLAKVQSFGNISGAREQLAQNALGNIQSLGGGLTNKQLPGYLGGIGAGSTLGSSGVSSASGFGSSVLGSELGYAGDVLKADSQQNAGLFGGIGNILAALIKSAPAAATAGATG